MADELRDRTIAILATDGVEQVELEQPRQAVQDAGAQTVLLSIDDGEIQAMNSDINPADTFAVDGKVSDASIDDYDALILPGGTCNPDKLRMDEDAVRFVRDFVERRQAGRRHLPRPVDARRGRRRCAAGGSPRGRASAPTCAAPARGRRRGGRHRRQPQSQPQPRRPAGVLRGDRPRVLGGARRRAQVRRVGPEANRGSFGLLAASPAVSQAPRGAATARNDRPLRRAPVACRLGADEGHVTHASQNPGRRLRFVRCRGVPSTAVAQTPRAGPDAGGHAARQTPGRPDHRRQAAARRPPHVHGAPARAAARRPALAHRAQRASASRCTASRRRACASPTARVAPRHPRARADAASAATAARRTCRSRPCSQSIAQCESHGNPRAISAGGTYRGKYQFSFSTWATVGGKGDPAAASETEQDRRAAMLYRTGGPGHWPVCGR